ncbi:hypothetical protein LTR06_011402 [Exophiala xenobiotica]|nr:hypothetical protein LTR06_011402 [Exophiala xenobiotica]
MTLALHIISSEMPSFPASTIPVPPYTGRSRAQPTDTRDRRKGSAIASAIGLRKKNEIYIILDGDDELAHLYSTHDEIKGYIEVKFEKDTEFDELTITFQGQSSTVQQPIAGHLLPEDNIFEANATYKIPFTFVVPNRLLPFICSHKIDHEEVRREHVQLPPSLGDASISGDAHTLVHDLAPDMARICYSIRARITKYNAVGRLLQVADGVERIRIVSARDEAPPLMLSETYNSDHALRKEKSVRKGLFRVGKTTGRLIAETTQPKSLRLPHPRRARQTSEPVATMATINFRFDPSSPEEVPPQLDSITSKLKVYTFFGAAPYRILPEIRKHDNWSAVHGVYPESVPLSSRNLSTVSWTRHPASTGRPSFSSSPPSSSDLSRRPSTYSTASSGAPLIIPEPSGTYQAGSPFYTASVLVPITLPTVTGTSRPKIFVPTFHTCIISRTYSVELSISFRSPGATTIGSSHVVLKTPIQVSAVGGIPPALLSEWDASITAEIEAQFGIYEARALRGEVGNGIPLEGDSPRYEESSPARSLLSGARHLSLEDPTPTARVMQTGIDVHARASQCEVNGAPPEYRA